MAMELRPVSSAPPSATSPASVGSTSDVKRAQLQAMLLQKTLQAQRDGVAEVARQTSGKGTRLDIRV